MASAGEQREVQIDGRRVVYAGFAPPRIDGALSDGTIIARMPAILHQETDLGAHQGVEHVLVYERDGTLSDTLGEFPGNEVFVYQASVRPGAAPQKLLGATTFGEIFRIAVGSERIAIGTGKPYLARVYDRTGAEHAVIRGPASVASTADHVDAGC